MDTVNAVPAVRATRREWIGLAVLALPTLLLSLDLSVLYLALPRLSADLGADGAEQLWILDIYSFMLAGFHLDGDGGPVRSELLVRPTAEEHRVGRRHAVVHGVPELVVEVGPLPLVG